MNYTEAFELAVKRNAALNKATLRLMGEVSRLTEELERVLSVQDQIGWRGAAKEAESKLNTIVAELEYYAALDGLLAPLAAAVLAKIKETK